MYAEAFIIILQRTSVAANMKQRQQRRADCSAWARLPFFLHLDLHLRGSCPAAGGKLLETRVPLCPGSRGFQPLVSGFLLVAEQFS